NSSREKLVNISTISSKLSLSLSCNLLLKRSLIITAPNCINFPIIYFLLFFNYTAFLCRNQYISHLSTAYSYTLIHDVSSQRFYPKATNKVPLVYSNLKDVQ